MISINNDCGEKSPSVPSNNLTSHVNILLAEWKAIPAAYSTYLYLVNVDTEAPKSQTRRDGHKNQTPNTLIIMYE